MNKTGITAFALALLLARPVFPWGDDGHRLVARIAARQLNATTRAKIVDLLRHAPDDDLKLIELIGASGPVSDSVVEEALARIATWPDHMPGGRNVSAPWHYVDIALFESPGPDNRNLKMRCADDCIVWAIPQLQQHLAANQSLGKFTPDQELRFLVHFLGDIHQPLHTVLNADGAGNCIPVTNNKDSNKLHGLWDTGLVRRMLAQAGTDPVAGILADHQTDHDQVARNLDPERIAADSFALAARIYETAGIPTIPKFASFATSRCQQEAPPEILNARVDARVFEKDSDQLIRSQLYKAGTRLAEILNRIFR